MAEAIPKKKVRKRTIKQTKQNVIIEKDTFNQSLILCYAFNGLPPWRLAVVKDFRFPIDWDAPAQYKLLSIDDTSLVLFLSKIPYDSSKYKIKLPIYPQQQLQCTDMKISRVVTMDSALQAKYPKLMSFYAVDPENKLNTARIDTDGSDTKFMITYEGETYFIKPVIFNKKRYYVCYAKNDPNFIKQTFE